MLGLHEAAECVYKYAKSAHSCAIMQCRKQKKQQSRTQTMRRWSTNSWVASDC
eukprot:m.207764 g.207764  ORF g.207764 m.207764 type:complete len:53 (+) comp18940_c0_seq1:183-341(+)